MDEFGDEPGSNLSVPMDGPTNTGAGDFSVLNICSNFEQGLCDGYAAKARILEEWPLCRLFVRFMLFLAWFILSFWRSLPGHGLPVLLAVFVISIREISNK
jgi:hypothetical protein